MPKLYPEPDPPSFLGSLHLQDAARAQARVQPRFIDLDR